MLEVRNLSVSYDAIQAVKNISFSLGQGEMVALLGANGAGKTTTLKTISGLLRARAGSIVFEGRALEKIEPHEIVRLGVAHVPEGRKIFHRLTVLENLKTGAYIRKANSIGEDLDF